jgi:Na+/melibiose symporter-like transporter
MTMAAFQSAVKILRKGLRVTWTLLWMFLLTLFLAVALTILVKDYFGGFDQFKQWQQDHFAYLLIWRLFVYSALAWGWLSIRQRFAKDPASDRSMKRLRRCELLVIFVVCLFEIKHAGLI